MKNKGNYSPLYLDEERKSQFYWEICAYSVGAFFVVSP